MAPSDPLRIFYLANHAPLEDDAETVAGEGVYPRYHREMFSLLGNLGFKVSSHRDWRPLLSHPERFDFVFSLLNRANYRGSEIFVSGLAEYLSLPYLGARPHIRAVADDKYLAKLVAQQCGIRTPVACLYRTESELSAPPRFPGPYFAKPRSSATSRHLHEGCIQEAWSEMIPVIRDLLQKEEDVLVEQFVAGENASLPVIGGDPPLVLPPYGLYSPKKGSLVTYEQKRGMEAGLKRFPVDSSQTAEEMSRAGLLLYAALRPIDYMRLDFRIVPDGTTQFLEFNLCCNISSRSGFCYSAASAGLSHRDVVTSIMSHSLSRQQVAWQPF